MGTTFILGMTVAYFLTLAIWVGLCIVKKLGPKDWVDLLYIFAPGFFIAVGVILTLLIETYLL